MFNAQIPNYENKNADDVKLCTKNYVFSCKLERYRLGL